MIDIKQEDKSDEDLGFGKNPTTNNQRLLNKDGSSNIKRKGLPFFKPYEAYTSINLYEMEQILVYYLLFLSLN